MNLDQGVLQALGTFQEDHISAHLTWISTRLLPKRKNKKWNMDDIISFMQNGFRNAAHHKLYTLHG